MPVRTRLSMQPLLISKANTFSQIVLAGLVLQAIVVAVLAAGIGAGLSRLLAPLFPMNVIEPTSAYPLLAVIAVLVGLLSSATAVQRAATVDPAHAFGGP